MFHITKASLTASYSVDGDHHLNKDGFVFIGVVLNPTEVHIFADPMWAAKAKIGTARKLKAVQTEDARTLSQLRNEGYHEYGTARFTSGPWAIFDAENPSVVAREREALHLGFPTADAMRDHKAWLESGASPDYLRWAEGVLNAGSAKLLLAVQGTDAVPGHVKVGEVEVPVHGLVAIFAADPLGRLKTSKLKISVVKLHEVDELRSNCSVWGYIDLPGGERYFVMQ